MMAVGAVENCGVCGFQAPVDARCVHGERRRPRPWCSGTLASSGLPPYALGRRRRDRLPRQRGGGFPFRSPAGGGAAPWGGPAPCVEPVGRRQCARSRTTMHGTGVGARASTEPAGMSRYVNAKPRHPNSHWHGTGMEGSGLDHGPRTRAKYCQPYCQPFLSPRVLFGPRESSVGPRFPQQNRGLLRFLDCRERVRSPALYPAELRARTWNQRLTATIRPVLPAVCRPFPRRTALQRGRTRLSARRPEAARESPSCPGFPPPACGARTSPGCVPVAGQCRRAER